ncbi:hypothetical protein BGY98DRAFT_993611 [Russula aff. rugulosa BPL654]|nr:hypothetical protein BGY98DRAFT_993611 [Russula aff. rugulosa BPL654]
MEFLAHTVFSAPLPRNTHNPVYPFPVLSPSHTLVSSAHCTFDSSLFDPKPSRRAIVHLISQNLTRRRYAR